LIAIHHSLPRLGGGSLRSGLRRAAAVHQTMAINSASAIADSR